VNDYVREIDTVKDDDGCGVTIGVDYHTVSVSGYGRFNAVQSAEFSRLYNVARMEAARNKRRMDEDAGEEIAAAEVYGRSGGGAEADQ
jgi:hypothetical protein